MTIPDRHKSSIVSESQGITRRGLMQKSMAVAALVGTGDLLAACGGSSSNTTTVGGTPQRGGTLRAALSGGSSGDTFNALGGLTSVDWAHMFSVYEPLQEYGDDLRLDPLLADEFSPNSAATEWTIRLRKGITFHNGKDLTADDLLYTFRLARNQQISAQIGDVVDWTGIKKLDSHTVRVPLQTPFAILDQVMAGFYFMLVPTGWDPKNPDPIGTGPYKVKQFKPGQTTTLVRNDNYWQTGVPYLDEIVMTDYADTTSQVNALLSDQVDVIDNLTADVVSSLRSAGKQVLISPSGAFNPFTMRVDSGPTRDVRVRQALRLVVDRPQLLELAYGGYGKVGNDLFGVNDPAYDHDLPQRRQDYERAKALLKSAGQEGLSISLFTAPLAQGVVKAAQVFAEQAAGAGIKVNVTQRTVADFFSPGNYLTYPFAGDFWYGWPYLVMASQTTVPGGQYNQTHFNNSTYNRLYDQAVATTDAARQREIVAEMQKIDYDEGGFIIPAFQSPIDGASTRLHGVGRSLLGLPLGNFAWKNMWLD